MDGHEDHLVMPQRLLTKLNQEEHECCIGYDGYYVEPAFLVVHRSKGERKVLDIFREPGRAEEKCRELAAMRSAALSATRCLRG